VKAITNSKGIRAPIEGEAALFLSNPKSLERSDRAEFSPATSNQKHHLCDARHIFEDFLTLTPIKIFLKTEFLYLRPKKNRDLGPTHFPRFYQALRHTLLPLKNIRCELDRTAPSVAPGSVLGEVACIRPLGRCF